MEEVSKVGEWKIVKRLTKSRIKSFALDEETCRILDSKPNASEYIRRLVKEDTYMPPIKDYTGERLLMTYCECWIASREAGLTDISSLPWHELRYSPETFPAWNELTTEEVEDMQKTMENQVRIGLEARKRQGTDTSMSKDALLVLQKHKGKAMEQLYKRFRRQWIRDQSEE